MEKLTKDFQLEIFKFIVQSKLTTRLVKDVNDSLFTFPNHQALLNLLKQFINKYKRNPKKVDFQQFVIDSNKKSTLTPKEVESLQLEIDKLYEPLEADYEYLQDSIIDIVKKQQMYNLFREYAPRLGEGDNTYAKMYVEFEHVLNLSLDEQDFKPIPTSIFDDWDNDGTASSEAYPSFLNGLNNLTSQGGFSSPELIGFLGLPKAFKTGTMLNLAVFYAMSGMNVFIADFENGQRQMRTRIKQTLLDADYERATELKAADLEDSIRIWTAAGGSIWVGSYTAYQHSTRDVEHDMNSIIREKGLVNGFGCVVWDYADIMAPTKKQKEKRLDIDKVYHDIIALHKRQECFGFTASHTNRSALNKFEPDMADVSEDWGKMKNAHGFFYISQDPETEAPADIARIGVVMQRMGVKSGHFYVGLDYSHQTLVELSEEDYTESLAD